MAEFVYKDTVVYYERAGSGMPLLALHGWGMDRRIMSGCMEPVFDTLDGFERIYADLPGMGRSKAGFVRNSDDMLTVLSAFVADVIGGRPFLLMGESYGGLLARGIVSAMPDMVAGMILLCPLMIPGFRKGKTVPLCVQKRDDAFLKTLTPEQYASFTFLNVVLTESVWKRYDRDITDAIKNQDRNFLDNMLDGAFSFDVDAEQGVYKKPVLILTGRQDTEVGFEDQLRFLTQYPHSTYIAVDCAGHNMQLEQPEIFHGVVRGWLQSAFLNK